MQEISKQLWTKSDALGNGPLVPKGIMVHSTASPGVSAQRFRDRWNVPGVGASVHYFVDDKSIIQCLPTDKRAGHCAGAANKTHIAFEMCEPTGLQYNSNGSALVRYAPPAGYFAAVWENAVGLCAMLCRKYALDPLKDGVILSHAEGAKRGLASNHADVGHWFPHEGKTMDDFRRAVRERLDGAAQPKQSKQEEESMQRYQKLEEIPAYASEVVTRLVQEKILQGNEKGLDLSEDMLRMLVILARSGVL